MIPDADEMFTVTYQENRSQIYITISNKFLFLVKEKCLAEVSPSEKSVLFQEA